MLQGVVMADVIFVFPKGIVQRKEYLFKALHVEYEVNTDANDLDILKINRTSNWGKTDFAYLTSALRLEICRSENLVIQTGKIICGCFIRLMSNYRKPQKNLHGEAQVEGILAKSIIVIRGGASR
jgi:hypothetical protein